MPHKRIANLTRRSHEKIADWNRAASLPDVAHGPYAPNRYHNGAPVDHISLGYAQGGYAEKFERPFLIAMDGGTVAYCFNFNYLERMEFLQTTAPELDNQDVTVINLYFSK